MLTSPPFKTVESIIKCWFVCMMAIFSSTGLHWVVILFNLMYIYATHMYICFIYFHQNKSYVSIYQKEMIHSKWFTLRTTVFEKQPTGLWYRRGLRCPSSWFLLLGTGLILDLRMWKDYKILVKITNEKGSCLAENIFIY